MPRFCISRHIVGSERDLVYDDGSLSFVDIPPEGCWFYDGNLKVGSTCLDTLFKLEHVQVQALLPQESHVRALNAVAPGLTSVPWAKVLTLAAYKSFVKNLIKSFIEAMDEVSTNYYVGTWVPSGAIFDRLVPAKVDKKRWLEHFREEVHATNRSNLETFEPDAEGCARPIVYDRMKTRTGRLSVSSGPQILTLKKTHRDVLTSRYGEDGTIVYVDFASLEVRIILHEAGRWFDEVDIYARLASDIFNDKVDRSVVKGAVISELYGVSSHRLGQILRMGEEDVKRFIGVVRTYFDVDALLKRVKGQYARNGHVKNRYGRKVKVDEPLNHVLLNSYVQSTGVDVSMLGFTNLVKTFEKKAPSVRPLFILHDAMILDVHRDELQRVKDTDTVRVKGYVQKYRLHVDELSRI